MTAWKLALASAIVFAPILHVPILHAQSIGPDRAGTPRPWMATHLSPDKRADLLLAQMSSHEKVALLHGSMAMPFGRFQLPTGAIGSAGFVPGNDRLGIPALQESDASLGVANPFNVRPGDTATPLPSGLALAATWNPDIAHAGGAMIGREARAKGINVMLAGGVNLARDPRNGRNFEYLGEDPLLVGTLAGASIRGIQDQHVLSTVKHFALNDQEHLRQTLDVKIGEAAARESDLLAFQIAIEQGRPGSVMCAYNKVGSTYACANDWLLNRVLKHDWGYAGFVMSDWGAVPGVGAASAGLDQQSGQQLDEQVWFDAPLEQAVASGRIPAARLDDMARRILRSMFAAGLFDHPSGKSAIDYDAHAAIARHEAEEGIVLLDNRRGLLPLAAGARKIAVIGGHADAGILSGGGSSSVVPHGGRYRLVPLGGEGQMAPFRAMLFDPDPPLAAIRERAPKAEVRYDDGAWVSSAVEAAKAADVAVVFAIQPNTEGDDTPDMSLPWGQDQLIDAVASANPNTIVVLETGNPIRMPWADKVGAVLAAWYPGARGGQAIADILFGAVNPSGRLPLSWPVDESQLPRLVIPGAGTAPGSGTTVDYGIEGSDVGYRWFARQGTKPRFPFGYGRSYTSFRYQGLKLSGGRTVCAEFDVTNSGARAGKEVAQMYLVSAAGKPVRRLIGFAKVDLQPGETRHVGLTADPRLLASFDTLRKGWRIDRGAYRIMIGSDAATEQLAGETAVSGTTLRP
jgi:beta-glucosidase